MCEQYSIEPVGYGHHLVISSSGQYMGKCIDLGGFYVAIAWYVQQRTHAPFDRTDPELEGAARSVFEDYCFRNGIPLPESSSKC